MDKKEEVKRRRQPKELNKQIGERCRKARETAGYTQEQLADQIGVSTQFLSDAISHEETMISIGIDSKDEFNAHRIYGEENYTIPISRLLHSMHEIFLFFHTKYIALSPSNDNTLDYTNFQYAEVEMPSDGYIIISHEETMISIGIDSKDPLPIFNFCLICFFVQFKKRNPNITSSSLHA